MKNSVRTLLPVLLLMVVFNGVNAQQVDSIQAQAPSGDEIISLDAQEIKITIEKPQVTIISDRIKPEFDDVHLDKSFALELTGEGEKFIFEIEDKFEAKQRIDIDKLLKKIR